MKQITKFKDDEYVSSLIDIIRGIAILLVILVHVRNFVAYYGGFNKVYHDGHGEIFSFLTFGGAGVALFFLISGFLLDFLYKNSLKVKSYLIKRIARIFPAWLLWHLIALAIAYLGLSWSFGQPDLFIYGNIEPIYNWQTFALFIASLFFLGWINYSLWIYIPGGWSIQSEVQHYFVFPILNKMSISWILFFTLILQAAGLISGITDSNKIAAAFITTPLWFVLGIVLSRVVRRYKNDENPLGFKELNFVLLNIAFTLPLQSAHVSQLASVITIMCALAISIAVVRFRIVSDVLKKIGKYSYGMYFNHFFFVVPISYFTAQLTSSMSLIPVVAIIVFVYSLLTYISYVFAKFSYEYYEKYFIQLAARKYQR